MSNGRAWGSRHSICWNRRRRGGKCPVAMPRVTNLSERTARDLLAALVADGVLASDTPKGPVSLQFPLRAAEMLFP